MPVSSPRVKFSKSNLRRLYRLAIGVSEFFPDGSEPFQQDEFREVVGRLRSVPFCIFSVYVPWYFSACFQQPEEAQSKQDSVWSDDLDLDWLRAR